MYIKTNNKTYPCLAFRVDRTAPVEARFQLDGETLPAELGDTVELYQDDDFMLVGFSVADFTRWTMAGNTLVLTDRPVPTPVPPDMDALRSDKLREVSDACRAAIVGGCSVTLTDGTTNHYALEETDQINLTTALAAVEQGAEGYPYHADGQLCRIYPAADILAIAQAATAHKLYHTTYCNHLMAWVRRAETPEELEGIIYGVQLPADLAANMEEVLGNV